MSTRKPSSFQAEAQAAAADARRKARESEEPQKTIKLFCHGFPWGVNVSRAGCSDREALFNSVRTAWPHFQFEQLQAVILNQQGSPALCNLGGQNDISEAAWSQAVEQATRMYLASRHES